MKRVILTARDLVKNEGDGNNYKINVVLPNEDNVVILIPEYIFAWRPDYRFEGDEFGLNLVTQGHYC